MNSMAELTLGLVKDPQQQFPNLQLYYQTKCCWIENLQVATDWIEQVDGNEWRAVYFIFSSVSKIMDQSR